MDRIRIRGGNRLTGRLPISGSKNAALPLMATALLTDEPVTLTGVPRLADIRTMSALLGQHGVEIVDRSVQEPDEDRLGAVLELAAPKILSTTAPYDIVRKMRASVLVLGPLLARCGKAEVSLPGGCAIGTRPVDLHISGLEAMGAEVSIDQGYIHASVPAGRLKGARVVFPKVSVGATENLLMAAALADGETVLVNAAREPEIVDLGLCLQAMGARIEGLGTDTIHVQGVDRLSAARHPVIPDRIETGTYAMAAAIAGGDVLLQGARIDTLQAMVDILRRAGIAVTEEPDGFRVACAPGSVKGVDAMTEPYPGFPTDLQAQFMALMCTASGASMITETIFENRFMHVPELMRMGADITVHQSSVLVRGVESLTGAQVMATDLRASVSLVLAGLMARGETIVNRVYHLDRGYEELERKLSACGADIERIADDE
ncbi:UDP-N-acetylglucosamine 1-carboxyvinyltransferase [Fodinicurvata sp. EGI_FJ10296]|uniref:UDP-N-acetylglucosamine 1-carboxyvinyltransferase n=1 Tax=Fodinicurvata sp. EGI_FJ10296 TaxID=3231908 RepID=UPI0034545CA8